MPTDPDPATAGIHNDRIVQIKGYCRRPTDGSQADDEHKVLHVGRKEDLEHYLRCL